MSTAVSPPGQTAAHPRLRWAVLLLLPAVTSFYLMQFILGTLPWEISPGDAAGNILCILAVHLLLCALTGLPSFCFKLTHILWASWGSANYFVLAFRGTPILPWDLSALGTAADVAGSYRLHFTPQIVTAIVIIVAFFFLLRPWNRLRFRPSGRLRHPRLLLLAAGAALSLLMIFPQALGAFGVEANTLDQGTSYRREGAVAVFFRNLEFLKVTQPEDTSGAGTAALLDGVEEAPASPTAPAAQPNIIAIMNESWTDYEVFGNLELTADTTGYISSLSNAIRGYAYTSTYGAGTSSSEFEFLTGNSMAFLPAGSIPYQKYLKSSTSSLASLLKEQGYDTLAFHPGTYTSWSRNTAYPLMGFDRYLCGADMTVEQELSHGYINDESDYRQIIAEFENKEEGQPLFLFNVTIQNHGGFTDPDYPVTVQLADCPGAYPQAEQYLSLARESDQAFRLLVDYFSDYDEPTIIVMFGDHQPYVESGFLEQAFGAATEDMTPEQHMMRYQVPFVIWANYPLEDGGPEETSLNFLGQYLLYYAGAETSAYGSFLWSVREELPVLAFSGCRDREGNWFRVGDESGCGSLIEAYRQVQFNNLFGGQDRQSQYFR